MSQRIIVITGAGRDGMTMLGTRLGRSPDVRWLGSFDRHFPASSPVLGGEDIFRTIGELAMKYPQRYLAFKLPAGAHRTGHLVNIREALCVLGVEVFSMRRRNMMRQMCSMVIDERNAKPNLHTFIISKPELMRYMARIERMYRMDDRDWACPAARRHMVDFESIAPQPWHKDWIWEVLGIPVEKGGWVTKRLEQRKVKDIIRNWTDVQMWMQTSRWANEIHASP